MRRHVAESSKRHLMPLPKHPDLDDDAGGKRARGKRHKEEERPLHVASEPTTLERKYELKNDLASTTSRIDALVADYDRSDAILAGGAPLVGPEERKYVESILSDSAATKRSLKNALLDVSEWQRTMTDARLVETVEAEAEVAQLQKSMRSGWDLLTEAHTHSKKTLGMLEKAVTKAKEDGAKAATDAMEKSKNSGDLRKTGAARHARELKGLQAEVEKLTHQLAIAHDGIARADAHGESMAKMARDAKDSAQTIKEEYGHELDQLNALVANFQQADRIAHLGWRDAQAKAALDEIQDLSNSKDSPAELKRELDDHRKQLGDVESELRSNKGVLSTVQHELETLKVKDKKPKKGAHAKPEKMTTDLLHGDDPPLQELQKALLKEIGRGCEPDVLKELTTKIGSAAAATEKRAKKAEADAEKAKNAAPAVVAAPAPAADAPDLSWDLDRARETIADLEQQLGMKTSELEFVKDKRAKERAEYAKKKPAEDAAPSVTKEEVAALEGERDALQAQVEAAQTKLADLAKKAEFKVAELKRLDDRKKTAEAAVERLNGEQADLMATQEKTQDATARMQKKLEDARKAGKKEAPKEEVKAEAPLELQIDDQGSVASSVSLDNGSPGKKKNPEALAYSQAMDALVSVMPRAAKESEIPNFKGSDLGRFPLVMPEPVREAVLAGYKEKIKTEKAEAKAIAKAEMLSSLESNRGDPRASRAIKNNARASAANWRNIRATAKMGRGTVNARSTQQNLGYGYSPTSEFKKKQRERQPPKDRSPDRGSPPPKDPEPTTREKKKREMVGYKKKDRTPKVNPYAKAAKEKEERAAARKDARRGSPRRGDGSGGSGDEGAPSSDSGDERPGAPLDPAEAKRKAEALKERRRKDRERVQELKREEREKRRERKNRKRADEGLPPIESVDDDDDDDEEDFDDSYPESYAGSEPDEPFVRPSEVFGSSRLQTNASWDDVVGEDRLSNRGAFREETPEHYGGRLTNSFDEYEDEDDDSFVEIDEEDEVEKILNTYLKPAEQRHAHVQQRRSSLCGRDLAKIHEDYHANDGANLEEDDHEDLHHAIVNDDDHAFVHGQIEEIYAARVKADLDAVKEKLAKTEGELDAERQEKLELATKSAEQAREIAELNLFLKKAEKLLVEVRKRDASDPSKGQPKEGFGSHRANQQEDAHRRAMEETINMANAMKKSKVHQAAATVKSLIRMEGPAAEHLVAEQIDGQVSEEDVKKERSKSFKDIGKKMTNSRSLLKKFAGKKKKKAEDVPEEEAPEDGDDDAPGEAGPTRLGNRNRFLGKKAKNAKALDVPEPIPGSPSKADGAAASPVQPDDPPPYDDPDAAIDPATGDPEGFFIPVDDEGNAIPGVAPVRWGDPTGPKYGSDNTHVRYVRVSSLPQVEGERPKSVGRPFFAFEYAEALQRSSAARAGRPPSAATPPNASEQAALDAPTEAAEPPREAAAAAPPEPEVRVVEKQTVRLMKDPAAELEIRRLQKELEQMHKAAAQSMAALSRKTGVNVAAALEASKHVFKEERVRGDAAKKDVAAKVVEIVADRAGIEAADRDEIAELIVLHDYVEGVEAVVENVKSGVDAAKATRVSRAKDGRRVSVAARPGSMKQVPAAPEPRDTAGAEAPPVEDAVAAAEPPKEKVIEAHEVARRDPEEDPTEPQILAPRVSHKAGEELHHLAQGQDMINVSVDIGNRGPRGMSAADKATIAKLESHVALLRECMEKQQAAMLAAAMTRFDRPPKSKWANLHKLMAEVQIDDDDDDDDDDRAELKDVDQSAVARFASQIEGFQMANRTEPTQAAAGDLEITGHKSKHIDEEGDDEPIPLNSILEELRRSKFTRPQKETSKQDAALADAGRELAAVRDALINDMREGLHEQLGRMPATAARTAKLFDKQANALEHLHKDLADDAEHEAPIEEYHAEAVDAEDAAWDVVDEQRAELTASKLTLKQALNRSRMAITTANRLRKMKKFQDMDPESRGSLKFTDAERTILADDAAEKQGKAMEIAAGTVEQMMTGVTSLEAGDPEELDDDEERELVYQAFNPLTAKKVRAKAKKLAAKTGVVEAPDGHVDVDEETMKHLREHENARIQAQLKQLRSIIPKEDGGDTTDADSVQLHLNQLSALALAAGVNPQAVAQLNPYAAAPAPKKKKLKLNFTPLHTDAPQTARKDEPPEVIEPDDEYEEAEETTVNVDRMVNQLFDIADGGLDDIGEDEEEDFAYEGFGQPISVNAMSSSIVGHVARLSAPSVDGAEKAAEEFFERAAQNEVSRLEEALERARVKAEESLRDDVIEEEDEDDEPEEEDDDGPLPRESTRSVRELMRKGKKKSPKEIRQEQEMKKLQKELVDARLQLERLNEDKRARGTRAAAGAAAAMQGYRRSGRKQGSLKTAGFSFGRPPADASGETTVVYRDPRLDDIKTYDGVLQSMLSEIRSNVNAESDASERAAADAQANRATTSRMSKYGANIESQLNELAAVMAERQNVLASVMRGAPPAMPTRIIKVGAKKKKGRNSAKGFKGFVPPGAMLPGQDNGRQSMKADAPHEEPPPTAAPPPEPGAAPDEGGAFMTPGDVGSLKEQAIKMAMATLKKQMPDFDKDMAAFVEQATEQMLAVVSAQTAELEKREIAVEQALARANEATRLREEAHGHVETKKAHEVAKIRYVTDQVTTAKTLLERGQLDESVDFLEKVSPPVPEPLPEMKPIPHVRKKEGPAFGNNLMQQVTEQLRPGSPAAAPQLQVRKRTTRVTNAVGAVVAVDTAARPHLEFASLEHLLDELHTSAMDNWASGGDGAPSRPNTQERRRRAEARRKREEGATAEIREFSDRLRRQRSSIREEYQHHVDERVEAFVKNEMHENGAEAKRIANEIKQQIAKAQHDKVRLSTDQVADGLAAHLDELGSEAADDVARRVTAVAHDADAMEKLLFDEMNSVSSKNAFSIKKKQRRAEAADEEDDDDDDPDSDFKRNFDRQMSLRFKDRSRESVRDGPVGRVVSRLGKDARLGTAYDAQLAAAMAEIAGDIAERWGVADASKCADLVAKTVEDMVAYARRSRANASAGSIVVSRLGEAVASEINAFTKDQRSGADLTDADIEGIVSLVDEALAAKMVHREVHQESAAQQVIKYISGDISDNMSTQIRNLVASELASMAQQIGTSIARQLGADAQTTANVGKIISSHVKDNGRKGKGGVGVVIVDQLRTIIDTQRRATELMLQQRPQERVLVAGRSPTASPEPPREPAPHEFAPIRDDDGAAASPGKHAKKPKSPKKHHHSKKPEDPAAPDAADDDEAAASSDSDDEAAPPAVQEDEEFEETLTAVLAAVGDEEEPTLAVSSKALGGLEVEHESLVSLKEELLTLQRAHERAQAQTPDAAVDDDVREEVLVKLEVVNERLATVEEVRDEITGSIKGWGIDALVVARHENDKLARKAKAMAGWLAAVGNDGGNDAYKTYEGTSRAMAREIDARGGWRAALTLSDGSLNEDIDPTVWPPADAFKIMEQLMLYYKEEVNAQANAKFDAEDELLELRKKVKEQTQELEDKGAKLTKAQASMKQLAKGGKPRKSMFEAAASSNAVMHEGKMIDADQVGADDFDVDAFLKRPEGMADGRMTLDHLNKWQDERVAAASLRVEVAKVLSLVLGSPMALLVQRPMPDVDLDPINKFKDDMKRTAFGKKQLGNKASLFDADAIAEKSVDSSQYTLGIHAARKEKKAETSLRLRNAPAKAPVLLEDPLDVGPGPVEPPPDPKPGEAPPANTYADEIAVHYGPRNMEKAQSLLETVRRGMRGMKGYDGSEKDNERVHRTVVGALNKDKGDVTTLREILDRVVRREKEQRSQIDLLEREVRVIVRSQVENQRRVDALEAAYESESASDVVANLRAEIRSCHEDAERSEATIASLQETLAETNADDGQLERLEYMMAKYRDVAEIHGALLPQYAAVDEELEAVRTMSRLRKFKAGERDPLEAKAGQLQDRKDELEHRLLVIFREVQEVEKLMVRLYEKVEAATQFVFSGSSYRGMLVWASDKEERRLNRAPSPRLAAAARAAAAPVRSLLDPLPIVPKSVSDPLESAFGRGAGLLPPPPGVARPRDAPPTQKTQPGRVESYRSLANLAAKVTTKPRRDPEEDAAQVLNEATLKLKYNVMAGLEDRHKLRPLRNLPSTSIKRFQSRTG
ncbi:hypothetical protein AURANDRAFT_71891 [Aureococcus anophagefferens]|uniref:Uncharacterized protein n=1 Tax=Aureococcus anophagefferens TaxID=44056 RepID=F0YD41_AURAN|nr:hypothetical protein AURANDRAFT_71891 [Aureococcus anophagefferens]EGB07064.1 hypothetical protein AURANDRAFT_71891 [Aureococcus anophagefferens]|eukprot:XP_009038299.1 hypothetical protein AURANDRAFT_71891 [Aureococcus anophagefferens]